MHIHLTSIKHLHDTAEDLISLAFLLFQQAEKEGLTGLDIVSITRIHKNNLIRTTVNTNLLTTYPHYDWLKDQLIFAADHALEMYDPANDVALVLVDHSEGSPD